MAKKYKFENWHLIIIAIALFLLYKGYGGFMGAAVSINEDDCLAQDGKWVDMSQMEHWSINLGITTKAECEKYGGGCDYVFKEDIEITKELCELYNGNWIAVCENYELETQLTKEECETIGGTFMTGGTNYCFARNSAACETLDGDWIVKGCEFYRVISLTKIGTCDNFDTHYIESSNCWTGDFWEDTCLLPGGERIVNIECETVEDCPQDSCFGYRCSDGQCMPASGMPAPPECPHETFYGELSRWVGYPDCEYICEPPVCPSVCVPLWEIRNGECIFNECGSGCGADNINTFDEKTECLKALGKPWYVIYKWWLIIGGLILVIILFKGKSKK